MATITSSILLLLASTVSLSPPPDISLVGVNIFDSGFQILDKYGSPNIIEDIPFQNETNVVFTRLIYKTKSSQYSFVIDRFNRVVQIECLGVKDKNVQIDIINELGLDRGCKSVYAICE